MGDAAGPAAGPADTVQPQAPRQGLGLQCQYCHTQVEKAAYAGIPPTKTCINCHAQIWTNAELLEPVRQSWATGASIQWIRVHDLPDYVYFNHEIHVNKGIGCASCHGRVDQMPLMYHAEYAADGVVFELPSQSCGESAAYERDLQHGMGWAFEREAGVVYEHGQGWSDCAERELHDDRSFG